MTFDELLARQSGRFTRGQARTGGFSAYRIGRRIESGEWRVVHGRVLALAAVPDSLPSREWVALLSAGPGATFAGPSAARRHSFEISDARPCVLVPPDRRPDVPDGVVVLRRELPIVDIVAREDCLLTGRDCTVIDCALLLDEPAAMRFVERALQSPGSLPTRSSPCAPRRRSVDVGRSSWSPSSGRSGPERTRTPSADWSRDFAHTG